jgi:hypothetical protein
MGEDESGKVTVLAPPATARVSLLPCAKAGLATAKPAIAAELALRKVRLE